MELRYASVSVAGPVRSRNEDAIGFWEPDRSELRRQVGSIAVMADGVGGQGNGHIASRLAVDTALATFQKCKPGTLPERALRQMFYEASQLVYDASMRQRSEGRMATTLLIAHFLHGEVSIAHVGDCRAYLIRKGTIQRLTTDHVYVDLQVKMGLVAEKDAMNSPLRSVLTRSMGRDPITAYDFSSQRLYKGDVVLQCTDGLYGFVVDDEICDIACHHAPEETCQRLLALLERRGPTDNISIQAVQIHEVEQVIFFRGVPVFIKKNELEEVSVGSEIKTGQLLDDRFEIMEMISRSGMATIHKALDHKTNQPVAIKTPHLQFESDMGAFTRFEREMEIGTRLDHPCILKYIPIEGAKSRPYIVMELLEGQTLANLMESAKPLPERDAVKIASRICEALAYLHSKNVIHRDLKPQNIMICNDGSIRIMDFGIARAEKTRRVTFAGFTPAMGTPDYMAPEQVKGKRGDEKTDIYSLGTILYEMVTGSTLFEGESPYVIMNARLTGDPEAPRKLNPKISPVLEEIILHALERNPAARYESAAQMKAELDDYEQVVMTDRYLRLKPPQIWRARLGLLPLILIFIAVQIILFFVFLVVFKR